MMIEEESELYRRYMKHCIECCFDYCGGKEYMGDELCACDCETVCSDYWGIDDEDEYYD